MNPIEAQVRKQARSLFRLEHVNSISLKGDDIDSYIIVVGLEKDNQNLPSCMKIDLMNQIIQVPIEKEIHGSIVPYGNESIEESIKKQSNCLFLNQNVVSISFKGDDLESYFLDVGLRSDDPSLPSFLDVNLCDRNVQIPIHKKLQGKIISY